MRIRNIGMKVSRIWYPGMKSSPNRATLVGTTTSVAECKPCRIIHSQDTVFLLQEFTELVMLCKPCRVLFWQSYGHPCMLEDQRSVSPHTVLKVPGTGTLYIEYVMLCQPCRVWQFFMAIPACSRKSVSAHMVLKVRQSWFCCASQAMPCSVLAILRPSLHA
jgi:hypothetical protein